GIVVHDRDLRRRRGQIRGAGSLVDVPAANARSARSHRAGAFASRMRFDHQTIPTIRCILHKPIFLSSRSIRVSSEVSACFWLAVVPVPGLANVPCTAKYAYDDSVGFPDPERRLLESWKHPREWLFAPYPAPIAISFSTRAPPCGAQ